MWRFLSDRPAKWRIPLYLKDQNGFLTASTAEALQACEDCYRRVKQTEDDAERKKYLVMLPSLR
jgi:hypothetical protein